MRGLPAAESRPTMRSAFWSRQRRLRWPTFWVALAALVLQAAAPMLAQAAAELQGKTLVEVCTAYGVATVALDGSEAPAGPSTDMAAHHAPCVLSALPTLTLPPPLRLTQHALSEPPPPPARAASVAHPPRLDAPARWQARCQHAPPVLA
jgi:hypothetical protein